MKKIVVLVLFLSLFSLPAFSEENLSFGLISFSIPEEFDMQTFGYSNDFNDHIFVFGSENDPSSIYQNTGECISLLLGLLNDDEHQEIICIDECAALLTSSKTDSGFSRSIKVINNQSFVNILIKSSFESNADFIVESILSTMSAKEVKN